MPGVEDASRSPIRDITVVDNGAGFNNSNVRAFLLSDSTRKANRGNKDIRRFTWLKDFEKATIDSTYFDADSRTRRTFFFGAARSEKAGQVSLSSPIRPFT